MSSANRVAYVVPGAGDAFYCENCLRDATVARPLRLEGHTVVPVSLYLPQMGALSREAAAVFFGAVRLYLRHRAPRSAGMLEPFARILDSERVLRAASRRALSTRSSGLEEPTLALLEGERGSEAREVGRLALPQAPPVLGYLSRMSEAQGLGRLVEAFLALRRDGFPGLKLRVMGGCTADDRAFLRRLMARLRAEGASADVQLYRGFGMEARVRFLSSLTVLSVPWERGEALGRFLLEAMAAGVPVVQPDVGGYRELVRRTGGGVLYAPSTAEELTRALRGLLADGQALRELGRRGREAVASQFSLERVGRELAEAYEAVIHDS